MAVRREPAVLLLALLVPLVQAAVALFLTNNAELAAGINAVAVALAGAVTAVAVRSENQLPAIMGLAQAVLAVIAGFVVNLTPEQQAAVLAPIAIVAAFVVRDRVEAPAPKPPHVEHAA